MKCAAHLFDVTNGVAPYVVAVHSVSGGEMTDIKSWPSIAAPPPSGEDRSLAGHTVTVSEAITVPEAVGIFHRSEDLQGAIDELLSSGFNRAELSLLASARAVEEKLGHRYEKVRTLADDPTTPRVAYVSTEAVGGAEGGLIGGLMYVGAAVAAGITVASGGALAAAIAATALAGGTGGLVGAVLAKWVGVHHAHYLTEQMNRGGLLLWVRTPTAEGEKRAVEILRKYSGEDVHVHALPAQV